MSDSSDSEDCYGNVAQKLQNIKSKYEVPIVKSVKLSENVEPKYDRVTLQNDTKTVENITEEHNISLNDSEEIDLDLIIAQNSRRTRRSIEKANSLPKPATSRKKGKKATQTETATTSKRGRRGRNSTNIVENPMPRETARQRRRNTYSAIQNCIDNLQVIYSVGNTDEYPDRSDTVELFRPTNDVIIIDEEPMEDIEVLSVKVYWQSTEIIRFNLRKYQKFTTVFEYFSKRESIPSEKLLFTYNDKIITKNDTPDSIEYNIGKFIEGGILNQDVTKLVNKSLKKSMKNGISLKFQCMKLKKPYEIIMDNKESMHIAMVQFSEHIEVDLCKLKFYFDGDQINGKLTPEDLDLEGGECIDVRVMS